MDCASLPVIDKMLCTAQCTMRLVLIILEKYFLVMARHLLV